MSFVLIWKERKVLRRVMALGIVLCGLATPVYGQEKPGLAALNLKAQRGVDPDLAEMISDASLSLLRASGRFQSVIGSSDIQAMITAEQQRQAVGCDDDSCLAQLGGALGVPFLLSGSLGKVGSRLMLNLKLLAVDDAKVAGRLTKVFPGEEPLVDGLPATIDALLADAFGQVVQPKRIATGHERAGSSVAKQNDRGEQTRGDLKQKEQVIVENLEPKIGQNDRSLGVWLGSATGLVGLGLGVLSYTEFSGAQSRYDLNPTSETSADLKASVTQSNLLLGSSALTLAVGAAVWRWLP